MGVIAVMNSSRAQRLPGPAGSDAAARGTHRPYSFISMDAVFDEEFTKGGPRLGLTCAHPLSQS
jgi:hypothetical protein